MGIFVFYILFPDVEDNEETQKIIIDNVRKAIGPFATPDSILAVPGLPKTRSGKIMRRVLRQIAKGVYDDFGDVSTLADPSVVDAIVLKRKGL